MRPCWRSQLRRPKTPKAGAPVDLTGYWVAIVTEDWRYRMVTPPKGDYASVPISTEGKKVADAWDPAKDEAAGEQCSSYGAPAIMRVPGRLHILWEDDNTLRIDTDAGKQNSPVSLRLENRIRPRRSGRDFRRQSGTFPAPPADRIAAVR